MHTNLTHLDQYKALREEILQHLREIYRTELSCAIAVGAVYTWIMLHKQDIGVRIVWFIPPCILVACAVRCLALTLQIKAASGYLRRVEEAAFGDGTKIPGWERYVHQGRQKLLVRIFDIVAGVVWVVAIIASVVSSWVLSR